MSDPCNWRELFEAVKASRPPVCPHPKDVLGILTAVNGAKQFKHYCLSCGAPTTSAIAHGAVALVRETAIPAERFHALRESFGPVWRSQTDFRFDVWRSLYESYLLSWEWKKARRKALERTGNRCEECGDAAAHVHHKTYERIGAEADADLSPLCARCHEEHHPHMKADQARQFAPERREGAA